MTLVLTHNVVGQRRGEPVRLPNRRRRLSTIVARHRLPAGRPFIVSVHRRGDPCEIYRPNDQTRRLRATWSKTLVGPQDVVVITAVPLGGIAKIGLAIASIALIALAPYAAPVLAGSALFGAGAAAGGLTTAIQAGLVIGGVALGYAAQASKASGNKRGAEQYSITGGGNVPKPGARKPLLYGRRWSSPPLSQQDFVNIDGDSNVLIKRMTLGLGRYQVHRIRVGDALFWDEASGIQAPFNASTGPLGAAIEFLYEQPSTLAPGDIITSPSVGGQELPRPGGNPSRTPWFRLAPQGVSVDAAQMNWTYPAIYRLNKEGKEKGTSAGVVFFAQEINPNTGEVIGPEFELHRSQEPDPAFIRTPLRRVAYVRLPKSGAYQVCSQNAFPEAPASETQENRVVWDAMYAFEDDTRVRPQTTEIALRMRAGKGLTVTAYSDISVEATRIIPVWNGSAWIEQPTRKAVWAYCDLVRAEYGLNAPSGVDADKALYYANLLTANDTYDGQLPEVASFWEAASEILHPLRADPVKVGAIHSFVRDESRAEPRHVLTRRQIVRDSGGATFKTKVEGGDVVVEFDRDGDPKRPDEARFSYGPPSRTPKRYRVNGITDGAHALKHATWLAAIAVFRGAERKITTEWDGRLVYPGDHVLSDLWFLQGKQAYGVAARNGNLLTLDVTANVPSAWGYGSIRTRAGREWGILRLRGVGARGLELDGSDVAALERQTGLPLASVLASDTQDPTTVVLGDLVELQETYVARSAIPSDADHVQIEMVQDDARVWQLLDEDVIAPAPVNADSLAEPLVPEIAVLHARCVRIETGIEVVWGVSTTRGARNYEADLSYDGGATREPLSPFGPASSGRAPMRQADGPVTVRARAYGRTGLPGGWKETTFTTVAPIVEGAVVDISTLPLLGYPNLEDAIAEDIRKVQGIRDELDTARQDLDAQIEELEATRQSLITKIGDARTDLETDIKDAREDAATAVAQARGNLDALIRSLALDPSVRQGAIIPLIGDLRQTIEVLSEATARNLAQYAKLDDALRTAGLEILPEEGLVRFYAIEALRTETELTISNFAIEVDALAQQIELYGSVQTGDLDGLITKISTVQTRLDALAGTITNTVSIASFNNALTRISTAEQTLSAATGDIKLRATIAELEERDLRISSAEQRISAAEGTIVQSVTASSTVLANSEQMPKTLAALADYLSRQVGNLSQTLGLANQAITSRIDEAGRVTSSVRTELGAFKGDAEATFVSMTEAIAAVDFAQVSQTSLFSARFGDVEATLARETTVRSSANEALTRELTGAVSRIDDAEAAAVTETQTRVSDNLAISKRVDTLSSTVSTNTASITTTAQTLTNYTTAAASLFQDIQAVLNSNSVSITSISSAYTAADLAIGKRIDTLTATVAGNTAAISTNAQVLTNYTTAAASLFQDISATFVSTLSTISTLETASASADLAISKRIDLLTATVDENTASIATSATAFSTYTTASAELFQTLIASVGVSEGKITSLTSAYAEADRVIVQSLEALAATVGGNTAAISTNAKVLLDYTLAAASLFQDIAAEFSSTSGAITSLSQVTAEADRVNTQSISSVSGRVDTAEGYITELNRVVLTPTTGLVERFSSLNSRVDTAEGGLSTLQTVVTGPGSSLVNSVSDLYALSNAGTAFGRFSMSAVSAPSGVSVRLAAQISTERGGQQRNAGYYLDLLPDGTSRYIIDANQFAITANGGVTYPFTFDGQTLTIPSLRVTQSAMLPGAAVDPRKSYVENYTIPAITGDVWTEVPGSEIYFNVDHAQGFPVAATVYTNLYVQLINGSSTLQIASIETAIAIDGNAWNNRNTVYTQVTAGNSAGFQTSGNANSGGTIGNTMMAVVGPGVHRLSIVYKFKGPASGAGARINAGQIDALISKR